MIFYHGTSQNCWEEIQKEGVLFGLKCYVDNEGNVHYRTDVRRQTYLTVDQSEAQIYGSIILQVDYNPYDENGEIRKDEKGRKLNTYDPSTWKKNKNGQWEHRHFVVYEPIDIKNVKQVEFIPRKI